MIRRLAAALALVLGAAPAGAWTVATDGVSRLSAKGGASSLRAEFELKGEGARWAEAAGAPPPAWTDAGRPLLFDVRARASATLEIKLIDGDGSVFLARVPLKGRFAEWTPFAVYRGDLAHGWGGDGSLSDPAELRFAVSGPASSGSVEIRRLRLGEAGVPSSVAGLWLDPDRDAPGFGFKSRRAESLAPEDPGVLEWLKAAQDASPDGRLLGSMEDDAGQTFNNALAAMAFTLKGEKARAERILDYFATAAGEGNADGGAQAFFLNGEARGFYQNFRLAKSRPLRALPRSDRWMGDNAWLYLACRHYERAFKTGRYARLEALLLRLIEDFYVAAGPGGYVRHGWRDGDARLHEAGGHHEGNIDAYAALRLAGRRERAESVRAWLSAELAGRKDLPLDVYAWRVLAMPELKDLLAVPESDLRYRKTVAARGGPATGFFHGPDPDAANVWIDGTGHMACAYFAAGDDARGNFYANQLDAFLIDRDLGGRKVRALPYAFDRSGGYDWVAADKGFVSCAAWYLFAKNRFNPLRLETSGGRP